MSLISAIKDAIFTETPSDVTINERSFISVMLDSSNNVSFKEDFRWPSYKGKSLMLTRYLIHIIVTYVVLGAIWLLYFFYSVIHWIMTGRWRGTKSSSGINFVIGATVLIITIIILIYILAFLIKDVVLSPNNARINNKGVITVDQPCLETHSFFLLNSATFWTSTDIQISEGDDVIITASGSMYSDIDDMYNAADSNRMLKYPRSIFAPNISFKEDYDAKYCVYGRGKNDKNPQFGSLLYQISTNHKGYVPYNIDKDIVKQMDFYNKDYEYSFPAEYSGVLYLAFNDILLDDTIFNRIKKDSLKSTIWKDLQRIPIKCADSIVDEQIWFKDNLGEVLVNVRIEKNIWRSDLPWYKKPLVLAFRKINHLSIHWLSACFIILSAILLWLVFDGIIISNICKKRTVNHNNKISIENE